MEARALPAGPHHHHQPIHRSPIRVVRPVGDLSATFLRALRPRPQRVATLLGMSLQVAEGGVMPEMEDRDVEKNRGNLSDTGERGMPTHPTRPPV